MVRLFLLVVLLACSSFLSAQTHMRVHYINGEHSDVAIEQIDHVTFVDASEEPTDEVSLTGNWVWANVEMGYYELLTFNDDRTYTGYDYYFTYGFDTMTYGWYMLNGSLLTLQSNGYGYNRRYTWFVMGLTENALDVMTKMGRFVYYRLQPEVITLAIGERLSCSDGETFVFADGAIVSLENNQLVGVAKGITYIQKRSEENTILSYKVVVE